MTRSIRSLALVAAWMFMFVQGAVVEGEQRCQGPNKRNPADFQSLGDGSQVKDLKTRLIWKRCVSGQRWTGTTCLAAENNYFPGQKLSYQEALRYAGSQRTAAEQWRLPTKAELLTLREPNCYNPSFNAEFFPSEPAWSSDGFFWTSTPEAQGRALVDAIGTSDAWTKTDPSSLAYVRLVRAELKQRAGPKRPKQ